MLQNQNCFGHQLFLIKDLLKKWLEESEGQDKNPKQGKGTNKTETTQSKRIGQFINNPITSKSD